MSERTNHTVVSTPGNEIDILTQDRDEWKRRALAAEEKLKNEYRRGYEQGSKDEREDGRNGNYFGQYNG